MLQTAIFVDAGYAFAQGAVALGHPRVERRNLRLNPAVIVEALTLLAKDVEPSARVLRVYWYDGLGRGSVMSQDQETIAKTEGVKCRFGTINSHGQQKGVDSLIVTDMIELARIQAISDALVLSGDEDVRVGVQVAQTFGIRVHVLGIYPATGSQSPSLIAEADTHHEWNVDQVQNWLSYVPDQTVRPALEKVGGESTDWLDQYVSSRLDELQTDYGASLVAYMDANKAQLPSDFDRPTLAGAREVLGRDLEPDERKALREKFRKEMRAKFSS
ncbi:MAG: NYN domain-containing protein [Alphaproteobacteria bacterium HGW-Alphaproteobacteria-15]|nr:MAG: NYN domain-containing protein [Alphaproteobacteria bacterium HGW-Alphaproteobacteria-15]